jgi:hypothetical protein
MSDYDRQMYLALASLIAYFLTWCSSRFRVFIQANHAITKLTTRTAAVMDSVDRPMLEFSQIEDSGFLSPSGGICWFRYDSR